MVAGASERKSASLQVFSDIVYEYNRQCNNGEDYLIADDSTSEALTSLLSEEKNCAIISAEGGIFGTMAGRYSKDPNLDIFLKAYSGDSVRIDRKTRDAEVIDNPIFTILLMSQPSILAEVMSNSQFRGRGLTSRFLYCIPKSLAGSRTLDAQPIPEEAKTAFKKLLFAMLAIPTCNPRKIICLSSEAYQAFSDFYISLESCLLEELNYMQDWAGKLHGMVLRIAGVLHATENLGNTDVLPVSLQTMAAAISIGNYYLAHAKVAYDEMGFNTTVDDALYLLSKIKLYCADKESAQGAISISKRELLRLSRRFHKADDMQPALSLLIEAGYLRQRISNSGNQGRNSAILEINPYVTDSNLSHMSHPNA